MLETKTWFEDHSTVSIRFQTNEAGNIEPVVLKGGYIIFHVDRCDPETGEVKENDIHVISFTGFDLEPQLGKLA